MLLLIIIVIINNTIVINSERINHQPGYPIHTVVVVWLSRQSVLHWFGSPSWADRLTAKMQPLAEKMKMIQTDEWDSPGSRAGLGWSRILGNGRVGLSQCYKLWKQIGLISVYMPRTGMMENYLKCLKSKMNPELLYYCFFGLVFHIDIV